MLTRAALPAAQAATKSAASPLGTLLQQLDQTREGAENPLRCVSCGNAITTRNASFQHDGQSSFHFVNPGGYQFDICLFSSALGCIAHGEASAEHSWFPRYQWRPALCDRCELHLGWFYQSSYGDGFWGLISALLTDA